MATRQLRDSLRSFARWIGRSGDEEVPGPCFILDLPPEILQIIIEYSSLRDITSLSRTCRAFHSLISDDHFWIHRIRSRFSAPLAQLYTIDLFQAPKLAAIDTQPCPSGFENVRNDGEIDRVACEAARYYNDEAIAKRGMKMFVSEDDFLRQLEYFQFKKPRIDAEVPLMKLVYFYLIDRKRTAAVTMDIVHRGNQYLVETRDPNSYTGRIIQLQHVCWLELTGRFEHRLMPGRYRVTWRMKCLAAHPQMHGETEFLVVPSHGKVRIHKISEDDFQNYRLEHVDQWFQANLGEVEIYEPSTIFIAIRNWRDGNWKSGIAWDCVELTLVS